MRMKRRTVVLLKLKQKKLYTKWLTGKTMGKNNSVEKTEKG